MSQCFKEKSLLLTQIQNNVTMVTMVTMSLIQNDMTKIISRPSSGKSVDFYHFSLYIGYLSPMPTPNWLFCLPMDKRKTALICHFFNEMRIFKAVAQTWSSYLHFLDKLAIKNSKSVGFFMLFKAFELSFSRQSWGSVLKVWLQNQGLYCSRGHKSSSVQEE